MQSTLRKQVLSSIGRSPAHAVLKPVCISACPSPHALAPLSRSSGTGAVLQNSSFSTSSAASAPKPLTGDPKQHEPEKFSDGLTGHCLCGSITVSINDKELFTRRRGHLCHCANCRKVAGSYVSSNLVIEEDKVTITDRDGTLKEYRDHETGSGKSLGRFFCSGCGNPIKSVTPAYAGKVVVKMGMFPRIPEPEFETFADHRHHWQGHHPEMTKYKIKAKGPVLEH